MNIKEAKEQIKNAMTAYFTKDEFGSYTVPLEEQRPVFLMGPPGIGKTAIMKQIAQELGVGLLSYSMTHHTRQSALGLPFIVHKNYDGLECDVSEYTMSEIISSIYDLMQNTGIREGILFLDEVNCVSETLAPVMLQFLQYKIFGRHKVPDGWIIVTAGNPPEYNNSVREFDIVTWDRLKRIDVEPDFDVWKEYAYKKGVHPAVMTYLEIKNADFYDVESTVAGKQFVTARGWDDLSTMIKLYEKNGLIVDEKLVSQYLQEPKIARSFAVYYDLFNKYRSDYQVDKIMDGSADDTIKGRAKSAKFDERLALIGLLLDAINTEMKDVISAEESVAALKNSVKGIKPRILEKGEDPAQVISSEIALLQQKINAGKQAGSLSAEAQRVLMLTIEELKGMMSDVRDVTEPEEAFKLIKSDHDKAVKRLRKQASNVGDRLANIFKFCEEVFEEGQEMLILVTELTKSFYGARFISRYGSEEYFKHNKELLFYERQQDIMSALDDLDLE